MNKNNDLDIYFNNLNKNNRKYNNNFFCKAYIRKNYFYKNNKKEKKDVFVKYNLLIEAFGYIQGFYTNVNNFFLPKISKNKTDKYTKIGRAHV